MGIIELNTDSVIFFMWLLDPKPLLTCCRVLMRNGPEPEMYVLGVSLDQNLLLLFCSA